MCSTCIALEALEPGEYPLDVRHCHGAATCARLEWAAQTCSHSSSNPSGSTDGASGERWRSAVLTCSMMRLTSASPPCSAPTARTSVLEQSASVFGPSRNLVRRPGQN